MEIMRKKEIIKMSEVENNYWWYKSLHELTFGTIKDNFEGNDVSILDAGCGSGGLMRYLISKGYKNIDGFDISDEAVSICNNVGLNVVSGDVKHADRMYSGKKYDIIISNDTLCYFSDLGEQAEIIERFNKKLNKNGIIILNVPALSAFGGIHDLAVGIKKRIATNDIKKLFGTKINGAKSYLYWPCLLSPVLYTIRTSQRIRMKINKSLKIESDIKALPGWLNTFLIKLVRFENTIFKWKPFASSLFLVIKKYEADVNV